MTDSSNTSRCSCSPNEDSSGKPLIGQIVPKLEDRALFHFRLGAKQNWILTIQTFNSILWGPFGCWLGEEHHHVTS